MSKKRPSLNDVIKNKKFVFCFIGEYSALFDGKEYRPFKSVDDETLENAIKENFSNYEILKLWGHPAFQYKYFIGCLDELSFSSIAILKDKEPEMVLVFDSLKFYLMSDPSKYIAIHLTIPEFKKLKESNYKFYIRNLKIIKDYTKNIDDLQDFINNLPDEDKLAMIGEIL